jgi:CelD/BcsL family acetyltransferase involved in cellulose biosynthesis
MRLTASLPANPELLEREARLELSAGTQALTAHRDAWDALAEALPSPFLTHAWLTSWADAYAADRVVTALLRGAGGQLLAGAMLLRVPGGFASPVHADSGDWNAVAVGAGDRHRFWEHLCAGRPPRLTLQRLREDPQGAAPARAALAAAGYGLLEFGDVRSPYVPLPSSFDQLLAQRSSKLRANWRRSCRRLAGLGHVRHRAFTDGSALDADLSAFLHVENSGWKRSAGTSILAVPELQRLYRSFAREAAERGWLRLDLLELDGAVIAGNLWCAIGGEAFGLKTGFDPSHAREGPGFVLQGEVFRNAIEEGLRGFDLGGAPDPYKLRWTDTVRARAAVSAYRGRGGRLAATAWRHARPSARRWRTRWTAARGRMRR